MSTTISKKIGKIKSISFGFGGYQNAMLGLSVILGSDGWSVGDFRGGWRPQIKHSDRCKWTEKNRSEEYAETVRFIGQLLTQAKKDSVTDLNGVPIEVEFDGNILKSWRILTEVI